MKKYARILKYGLSSGASFLIDNGMYLLLKTLLGVQLGAVADLVCVAVARAVSSFFNFNVNNRLVFEHRGSYGRSLLRYYCLAIPVMLCSAGLLTLVDSRLGITVPLLSTFAKIVIDTALFLVSYFVQKHWVFPHGKKEENENGDLD